MCAQRDRERQIDKERERIEQKNRTDSNQKMSEGKSNCQLDNERDIRDQKKKQEKNYYLLILFGGVIQNLLI